VGGGGGEGRGGDREGGGGGGGGRGGGGGGGRGAGGGGRRGAANSCEIITAPARKRFRGQHHALDRASFFEFFFSQFSRHVVQAAAQSYSFVCPKGSVSPEREFGGKHESNGRVRFRAKMGDVVS